jgi:hypothetical protein
MSLCHGPEPYREFRFPGGEKMDREFEELVETLNGFLERHAHTPFAQVIRRQGIARFHLAGVLKQGLPAPRWIPSSPGSGAATQAPKRPPRAGPSSGGGTGTPSSGGR